MKKTIALALTLLALTGCTMLKDTLTHVPTAGTGIYQTYHVDCSR